jgi:hypothetical protein
MEEGTSIFSALKVEKIGHEEDIPPHIAKFKKPNLDI